MRTVAEFDVGIYLPGKRDMVYNRIDTTKPEFEGVTIETHRFGVKVGLERLWTLIPWHNVKLITSDGELKP